MPEEIIAIIFPCEDCDKSFKSLNALHAHSQVHKNKSKNLTGVLLPIKPPPASNETELKDFKRIQDNEHDQIYVQPNGVHKVGLPPMEVTAAINPTDMVRFSGTPPSTPTGQITDQLNAS